MTRARQAFTLVSGLVFLGLSTQTGFADSLSISQIDFGALTNGGSGATSSSVSSGNELAASQIFPTAGAMKALTRSDGTANDLFTNSVHSDDWTCTGGCSALAAPLGMSATIGFDFDVIGQLPTDNGKITPDVKFIELFASYTIGSDVFHFSAVVDSSPLDASAISADFDGLPVDFSIVTDTSGNVPLTHVVADFTRHFFLCPCSATDAPFAHDVQSISLETVSNMTGVISGVDASHTFTVTLTPDDPNVVLTSADGRIAGTPVNAPVPEPASLVLVATGLAGVMRRYRRRA